MLVPLLIPRIQSIVQTMSFKTQNKPNPKDTCLNDLEFLCVSKENTLKTHRNIRRISEYKFSNHFHKKMIAEKDVPLKSTKGIPKEKGLIPMNTNDTTSENFAIPDPDKYTDKDTNQNCGAYSKKRIQRMHFLIHRINPCFQEAYLICAGSTFMKTSISKY